MMIYHTRNTPGSRRKSVTLDTLAAPTAFWQCHFPALCSVPQRLRKTMGGAHKKKGRLRCHKRPKSREETPKEGNDSGLGGVATA
jgi:hypothetical protein